ncbi:MAG: GNAT family N-acetyltransferase [Anaerolineae bacterium]|nr:GNAT family N-acetyltransferase [Thermoflexus sp.]MDW8065136.1 GNAT family N-acetyltransferase [Anaerolineae bacterium]
MPCSASSIRIRQEPLSGSADLIDLYLRAYRPLGDYYYRHRVEVKGYLKWLRHRDPHGSFVAYDGDRRIGFIATDSRWNHGTVGAIHELVVDPEYQSRGLGRALLVRGMVYLRSQGCRVCELWVGERNQRAQILYQSMGFQENGRWGKWIRMTRSLEDLSEDLDSEIALTGSPLYQGDSGK